MCPARPTARESVHLSPRIEACGPHHCNISYTTAVGDGGGARIEPISLSAYQCCQGERATSVDHECPLIEAARHHVGGVGGEEHGGRRDVVRLQTAYLERHGRRAVVPGLLRRRMLDLDPLLTHGFAEAFFVAGEAQS
jgi:hypothetical protein